MEPRAPFFTSCPVCGATERRALISFPELAYVTCRGCSLIYKAEQVPQLGVGYEADYFQFNRAGYLKRWNHRVRKCMRQLRDCLQVTPRAKVALDVGCSAGYVLEAARRLALEPIGVDRSKFAVQLCREKGFDAREGLLSKLPVEPSSVDVVTLKHTLEHVTDPLESLHELRRVLKPGGALLVVVPDADYWKLSVMPRTARAFRPELRGWQHHVYFSERTLLLAMERAGFEVVHRHKAVWRADAAPVLEAMRYSAYFATSWLGRVLRLRRELHFVARRT